MAQAFRWTKRAKSTFLDVLRTTGNVSVAARAAGVSRHTVYEHRHRDDDFRRDWDSALEEALDDLEATLLRRALEGTEKPVFYAGKTCGKIKSYNDNLGMFFLKNRRREVFGDSKSRPAREAVAGQGSAAGDAPSARDKLQQILTSFSARPDSEAVDK